MVDYAALTPDQRTAYEAAMEDSHHRRVEAELYRKHDGAPVTSFTSGPFSGGFLGGALHGDQGRTPVTYWEGDVLDVDAILDWTNGEHRHHELVIVDSCFVPDLPGTNGHGDWVSYRSFRGPLWSFTRDGAKVHFLAEGPEQNAMGSVRRNRQFDPGSKATDVVRGLLSDAGAARRHLVIPDLATRLPKEVTVGVKAGKRRDTNGKKPGKGRDNRRTVQVMKVDQTETYWGEARSVIAALARDLYGDNLGRFVVATNRQRPTLDLSVRCLLAPVQSSRPQDDEGPNTWVVKGGDPRGPRKRPVVTVELPRSHPSSAHAQRWGDEPRAVIEVIENDKVKRDPQARKIGQKARDRAARETVAHQVSLFPCLAYVRPYSFATIPAGPAGSGGRVSGSVPAWTIPHGPAADPLTLGANKRRGPG